MAGPAALLVAKLHKLGERRASPRRLEDKDAAATMVLLLAAPLCGAVTEQAMAYLREMFAAGRDALGSVMAGRAELGVGEPETVAASVALLAADLLLSLQSPSR